MTLEEFIVALPRLYHEGRPPNHHVAEVKNPDQTGLSLFD